MELVEQIRREYEHGVGTIQGVARKFGVHRRLVRKAITSAIPLERKTPVRGKPKLGPVTGFIQDILEADRKAPRKQRHTAHQIWVRLREELPELGVAECTVRRYVRERRREMGLGSGETFVPQSYRWEGRDDDSAERGRSQIPGQSSSGSKPLRVFVDQDEIITMLNLPQPSDVAYVGMTEHYLEKSGAVSPDEAGALGDAWVSNWLRNARRRLAQDGTECGWE